MLSQCVISILEAKILQLKLDPTAESHNHMPQFTARSSIVTTAQVIPSDISRQTERRRHPIKELRLCKVEDLRKCKNKGKIIPIIRHPKKTEKEVQNEARKLGSEGSPLRTADIY